jgi:hypothetical protein
VVVMSIISFTTGSSLLRAFSPYGWGLLVTMLPVAGDILEHHSDSVNPHFFGDFWDDFRRCQKAEIASRNRFLGEANEVSIDSVRSPSRGQIA